VVKTTDRALALNLRSMSYVKNWLHCVWGTKNRVPFIKGKMGSDIIEHIRSNARTKNIYIDFINGYSDHIHCLLSLNPDQQLSKVIQLIKGESSFWINRNSLTDNKFEWAVEYFAVSVSESHLTRVREYIKNQEEHHRKKSWDEEYTELLKEYEFIRCEG
jgi:putative transposase